MKENSVVSRCTGRIAVPSDPSAAWTPELLAQLFPVENRAAWRDVVARSAASVANELDPMPKPETVTHAE